MYISDKHGDIYELKCKEIYEDKDIYTSMINSNLAFTKCFSQIFDNYVILGDNYFKMKVYDK